MQDHPAAAAQDKSDTELEKKRTPSLGQEQEEQGSGKGESEGEGDGEAVKKKLSNVSSQHHRRFSALRAAAAEPSHGGPVSKAPPSSSRATSLYREQSYGDGHGHVSLPPNDDVDDRLAEREETENSGGVVLVHWDGGDHDQMNPRAMPAVRKWIIVVIISGGSLCVTCTSSLYTSTYRQIEREFHCSRTVATLGLSLFVAGLGVGPMLLAPLSEFYGRRPVYIASLALFVIWIIPCAVAQNIQTILIARFLQGFFGAAFLSIAGGSVGDLFTIRELQAPMLLYTASPFVGPVLGPLMGGFINQFTSWRWSFYVLLIWSGAMLLSTILLVPETYHPVLLRRKAAKLRKETGNDKWRAPIELHERSIAHTILWSLIRPFQLLFFEPMCLNLCILSALLLGILYLFFGAFPLVFETNHGFQLYQVGLSFLGLLVGMLLGIATDPFWKATYRHLTARREADGGEPGGSEPEFRLPPAILGAVLVPIGLFWFGWSSYSSVHWIMPIIGSTIFGMGNLLVFSGVFTFLVEAYPLYAASALAANSFARSSFAAAFPLFGVQMYEKLGFQWASSLLAFLAVAMMPFPYIFFRYGRKIRGASRFATASS